MDLVKEGQRVLYLWEGEYKESIEENVNAVKTLRNVSVNVENTDRIALASYENSTFDIIIFKNKTTKFNLLSLILKLLKPRGTLQVTAPDVEELKQNLLLSGFVNINETIDAVTCEKPNFEVGSSAKLTFAKKTNKANVAAVWKIDNDDDETIDADDLLDEADKEKPDPASLKVCGTTGKRKACKDCSCGLAEELAENDSPSNGAPAAKSSCGSCYLGDAFRCASCPYLGMPAFKAGEKIQLTDSLLKADI